jgi:hypothetical protein
MSRNQKGRRAGSADGDAILFCTRDRLVAVGSIWITARQAQVTTIEAGKLYSACHFGIDDLWLALERTAIPVS